MKFIELTGHYLTEDQSRFEDTGINTEVNFNETDQLPTLVNVDNIEIINPALENKTTIQFISGERWVFAESYDTVKKRINFYGGQ